MAYFANGSEGAVLDEQCAECLPHDPCPIAWVQLEYNYTQCSAGQEKMAELMNCLVDEKGNCRMKRYVKPRLQDKSSQPDRSALKRQLVFGDLEQISALKEEDHG